MNGTGTPEWGTSYHVNGVLTGKGRNYIMESLPKMNDAGLGWLTPILREMAGGDPWQEGMFALKITEAWEQAARTEE